MQRDVKTGALSDATDYFRHQTSLLQLADEDESHTIAAYEFWTEVLPFPAKQNELFRTKGGDAFQFEVPFRGRRLALVGGLGAAPCPVARLLAIVPENVQVGDQIRLVAGSTMPWVIRCADNGAVYQPATEMQRAYFIGEGYVNGGGEPVDMFEDGEWERLAII